MAAGYVLDDLAGQQLTSWRERNDRDVRHALDVLQQLGAVRRGDAGTVELTDLALWWSGGLVAEPGMAYPVCVAGEGACPPEDCGGGWGDVHLREVLADPAHEEHDDMLAWLGLDKGTDFDPNRFDLNHANRALRFAGATR